MKNSSPRVALAFAYDGSRFDSFARQPGRRTVEGELLGALTRAGLIRDARAARYEVASRTDRGVSARWNVCAFDTAKDPRAIAHIGGVPAGLHLLSAIKCGPSFSPRRDARGRSYTYHLDVGPGFDWAAVRAGANLFQGLHDFRNFSRRDEGVDRHRRITTLVLSGRGRRRSLGFDAPSFLWEQVRRIVHALIALGRHERTLASVRRQLESTEAHPEPPAPAAPLVLTRVETGLAFGPVSTATVRRLEAEARDAWARSWFYDGLTVRAPTRRR